MSDQFHPIPLKQLIQMMLSEYDRNHSILGIDEHLFFNPDSENRFTTELFDQKLATPLGVAAGPHSQMAQNIVAAWLTGARYIELKTVQTLDELEIPRPCIDMQDEGYNCEWSQELKIKESFDEYLKAWVLIHVLHHKLGRKTPVNTIFNMSVGYNLEGIMKENVQWFLDKMQRCPEGIAQKVGEISSVYPEIQEIEIPYRISDNITLSTMHGCPANEIEDIARYLITEKKLHTFVKLNPTLLGSDLLRGILNETLQFKTQVPDAAFEHDLKYPEALKMIRALQQTAEKENLQFGLKLTNTLESVNNKPVFGEDVSMMYMSGRALHPISIALTQKLQKDFNGELSLSFSGGINALNVADVLTCGFETITVCTDLLKPGGYTRLHQYFQKLNEAFVAERVETIEDFISAKAGTGEPVAARLANIERYAKQILQAREYKRTYLRTPSIKNNKPLSYFDCIAAPCLNACPTHQDIPSYMYHTARGEFEQAYRVITKTNAFPNSTSIVCDHVCQTQCTRMNYDEPLAIREIKHFVVDWHNQYKGSEKEVLSDIQKKVAIIGAGPTGLSSAYFLRKAGFEVAVYEAKSKAGGMVSGAIPRFRISDETVELDVKHITDLGVAVYYNQKIGKKEFNQLRKDNDAVIVAIGAQDVPLLKLDGMEAQGVYESLEFLEASRKGKDFTVGNKVAVIGGGNTAMDIARTANRMTGASGKVTLMYRRSVNEMPAVYHEIVETMEEGVEFMEWVNPVKIMTENGKIAGVQCIRMKPGEPDESGRVRPVPIEDSEFEMEVDTLIPAVGQKITVDFTDVNLLETKEDSFETQLPGVYIGGDARLGAASLIKGVGDGRKIAQELIDKYEIDFDTRNFKPEEISRKPALVKDLMAKKSERVPGEHPEKSSLNDPKSFQLITGTFTEEQAQKEASRCLLCDEVCNICTTVCPNLANFSYPVKKTPIPLQKGILENGNLRWEPDGLFEIKQEIQILNIANFCNECGNCATFCPTQSAPYLEKPKIYLTRKDFDDAEKGFYLQKLDDQKILKGKASGRAFSLTESLENFIYKEDDFEVVFDKTDFSVQDFKKINPERKEAFSLQKAAEMTVILQGASLLEYS
ncbi:MAG: putative selenate reductase subunit YgfK [Bacteroidales bacterium]|nr:putative selenate reductase subunit YgfK [Bacteroidales bacterium]